MDYGYTLITLLGGIASSVCGCIIQADLTEYRVDEKKARISTIVFTVFYTLLVSIMYALFGAERGGQLSVLFSMVPVFIFFFLISSYRNGKFFFSFFAGRIVVLSIVCLTNLIDSYFPTEGHLVHTLLRILLFPLAAFAGHKYLAPKYRTLQRLVSVGWNISSLILGIFYALISYTYNFPEILFKRSSDIPVFLLIITLVTLYIMSSTKTLLALQERNAAKERENLFSLQINSIKSLIEQTSKADERIKAQRHDLRHRYNTITSLLKENNISGALDFIDSSASHLDETSLVRYCKNTFINATVEAYAAIADSFGIRLETQLDIPEDLPVSSEELSVVFANALENAINAVKELPSEKRFITCKCISSPQLMLQIKNPFAGKVIFDNKKVPISCLKSHGVGTWSINSYCKKNNAVCEYSVQDDIFIFRLGHPSGHVE